MGESLKPKLIKTVAGRLILAVMGDSCFGHEAKEKFLDTANPLAVVLGTGASISTSVRTITTFNLSTSFYEQQMPERVSAERPPFNNGRAALVERVQDVPMPATRISSGRE